MKKRTEIDRGKLVMKWPGLVCRPDVTGFTLLEVLVSIVILVTVLSTVFASYTGTFRIVSETESQAEIYHMARTALERMLEDLESICVSIKNQSLNDLDDQAETDSENALFEFVGSDKDIGGHSADSMDFASRAHVGFGEEEQPPSMVKISYYAEEDGKSDGLVLFRNEINFLEGAEEEGNGGIPLCDMLASFDLKYTDTDGEEQDEWDPEDGIPRMVTISLGFLHPSNPDPEKALQFITSIAMPFRPPKEDN